MRYLSRWQRFGIFAVWLCLMMLIVAPVPVVRAQAGVVSNTNDSGAGSLRGEIAAASPGDTITFSFSGEGTTEITLTSGTIAIDKGLTIRNDSGNRVSIRLAAGQAGPMFTIANGVNVAFDGNLNLDGSNTGAIFVNNGNLTLTGIDIERAVGNNGAAIYNAGVLEANSITIANSGGANGAVFTEVSGSVQFNYVTITASAGSNLNSSFVFESSANANIDRSIFSGALAANGVVSVRQGNVNITNSVIADGRSGSPGIQVNTGATAAVSFTTISGNSGAGVVNNGTFRAKALINWGNAGGSCSGGALQISGRNTIEGACSLDTNAGGVNLPADPLLSPNGSDPTRFFRLLTGSPAAERATNCQNLAGATISPDVSSANGTSRPQGNACDLGSFEVLQANIQRGTVSVTTPGIINEVGPGATSTDVTFSLDIYPAQNITINLAQTPESQADCVLSTTQLTISEATYLNGVPLTITAIDDGVPEGQHTCTITASIGSTTDQLYANQPIDDIVVTINDDPDDLTPEPNVLVDYGTAQVQENDGLPPLAVRVSLDAPPTGNVNVSLVSQLLPANEQCTYGGGVTLDQTNWQTGETILVDAIDDGVRETTQSQCEVRASVAYIATGTTLEIPAAPAAPQIITVLADPPLQILADPQVTNPIGETGNNSTTVTYRTNPPIAVGSTEFYEVQITQEPSSPAQCTLAQASGAPLFGTITLNASNGGAVTLSVTAINDGIAEPQHQCLLRAVVVNSQPPSALNISDVVVPILEDPITNPNVIVERSGTTLPQPLASGSVEEGDSFALEIDIEARPVETPFSVRVAIASSSPQLTGAEASFQQCYINAIGTSETTLSFNETGVQIVTVLAYDDGQVETNPHQCVITVERRRRGVVNFENVLTYTVSIGDNDGFKAFVSTGTQRATTPTQTIQIPNISEGTGSIVTFGLTTAPSANTSFSLQAQDANGNPSADCYAEDINQPGQAGSIDFTPTEFTGQMRIFAPANANRNGNRTCIIKTIIGPVPSNYNAPVIAVGTTDDFVPDVVVQIQDAPPTSVPPPTNTPTEQIGPTPVSTVNPNATLTPLPTNIAATATPGPSPTPLAPLAVTLGEGINRLPVRTGPYLGASLVTVVLRDAAAAESGGEPPYYEVFATNNDENAEVTWYLIEANGSRGWVSGRATIVRDGIGVPVQGSIFDTIDGAPDVGVIGDVTRDRNLHRRPSTRAGIIGFVPGGAQVSIIGRTREITVDDWYHVRYNGQVGWILGDVRSDDPAVIADRELLRDRVPVR